MSICLNDLHLIITFLPPAGTTLSSDDDDARHYGQKIIKLSRREGSNSCVFGFTPDLLMEKTGLRVTVAAVFRRECPLHVGDRIVKLGHQPTSAMSKGDVAWRDLEVNAFLGTSEH